MPPFAFWNQAATGTCAGTKVGGYCWYLAAANVSCTTLCSSHGGYNDVGTRAYAGSDGTDANCTAVAQAVHVKLFQMSANGGGGIGCFYYASLGRAIRDLDATTAGAKYSIYQRYCACNN